jgi:hypothetical protein
VQDAGDLRVGEALLEQLEHVGLAWGEEIRPRGLLQAEFRRGLGRHVQAARGEVDGAEDVARLCLLRKARIRAEREHLVALGGRGMVGEHDEPRLRVGELQLVHVDGRTQ